MLETATLTVRLDEPAFLLQELNLPAPDFKSKRRYQIIKVVRQDKLVEWRRDLGLAGGFAARQFNILGGYVDEQTGRGQTWETVGSLMEMADQMREPDREVVSDDPDSVSRDWTQAFHDEADRRRRAAVGRKVFKTW